MKQKMVVSNIRFPYSDWLQVRSSAAQMGMSINEYFQYLSNRDTIRHITGTIKKTVKPQGYAAMQQFLNRQILGIPMGANEDDKIIYDIE